MEAIVTAFEAVMIGCFGISWPFSVYRSYRARTAKGKSLVFLLAIWVGYLFGVAGKIMQAVEAGHVTYVIFFYIFNLIVVSLDLALYFRNRRLDRLVQEKACSSKTTQGQEGRNTI